MKIKCALFPLYTLLYSIYAKESNNIVAYIEIDGLSYHFLKEVSQEKELWKNYWNLREEKVFEPFVKLERKEQTTNNQIAKEDFFYFYNDDNLDDNIYHGTDFSYRFTLNLNYNFIPYFFEFPPYFFQKELWKGKYNYKNKTFSELVKFNTSDCCFFSFGLAKMNILDLIFNGSSVKGDESDFPQWETLSRYYTDASFFSKTLDDYFTKSIPILLDKGQKNILKINQNLSKNQFLNFANLYDGYNARSTKWNPFTNKLETVYYSKKKSIQVNLSSKYICDSFFEIYGDHWMYCFDDKDVLEEDDIYKLLMKIKFNEMEYNKSILSEKYNQFLNKLKDENHDFLKKSFMKGYFLIDNIFNYNKMQKSYSQDTGAKIIQESPLKFKNHNLFFYKLNFFEQERLERNYAYKVWNFIEEFIKLDNKIEIVLLNKETYISLIPFLNYFLEKNLANHLRDKIKFELDYESNIILKSKINTYLSSKEKKEIFELFEWIKRQYLYKKLDHICFYEYTFFKQEYKDSFYFSEQKLLKIFPLKEEKVIPSFVLYLSQNINKTSLRDLKQPINVLEYLYKDAIRKYYIESISSTSTSSSSASSLPPVFTPTSFPKTTPMPYTYLF